MFPNLFAGLFLIFQGQKPKLFFIIVQDWSASLADCFLKSNASFPDFYHSFSIHSLQELKRVFG